MFQKVVFFVLRVFVLRNNHTISDALSRTKRKPELIKERPEYHPGTSAYKNIRLNTEAKVIAWALCRSHIKCSFLKVLDIRDRFLYFI